MNTHTKPALHNAMWPGLVGKGPDSEPPIDLGAWLLEQGLAVAGPGAPFEYQTLERIAEARKVHFHGFENSGFGRGHWNAEGHRAAAELIAQRLCNEK